MASNYRGEGKGRVPRDPKSAKVRSTSLVDDSEVEGGNVSAGPSVTQVG